MKLNIGLCKFVLLDTILEKRKISIDRKTATAVFNIIARCVITLLYESESPLIMEILR